MRFDAPYFGVVCFSALYLNPLLLRILHFRIAQAQKLQELHCADDSKDEKEPDHKPDGINAQAGQAVGLDIKPHLRHGGNDQEERQKRQQRNQKAQAIAHGERFPAGLRPHAQQPCGSDQHQVDGGDQAQLKEANCE